MNNLPTVSSVNISYIQKINLFRITFNSSTDTLIHLILGIQDIEAISALLVKTVKDHNLVQALEYVKECKEGTGTEHLQIENREGECKQWNNSVMR